MDSKLGWRAQFLPFCCPALCLTDSTPFSFAHDPLFIPGVFELNQILWSGDPWFDRWSLCELSLFLLLVVWAHPLIKQSIQLYQTTLKFLVCTLASVSFDHFIFTFILSFLFLFFPIFSISPTLFLIFAQSIFPSLDMNSLLHNYCHPEGERRRLIMEPILPRMFQRIERLSDFASQAPRCYSHVITRDNQKERGGRFADCRSLAEACISVCFFVCFRFVPVVVSHHCSLLLLCLLVFAPFPSNWYWLCPSVTICVSPFHCFSLCPCLSRCRNCFSRLEGEWQQQVRQENGFDRMVGHVVLRRLSSSLQFC